MFFTSRIFRVAGYLVTVIILTPRFIHAAPNVLTLTFEQAEQKAREVSLDSKRFSEQIVAEENSLEAQKASRLPRLILEGNYRYLTEVPHATLGPMDVRFGQHNNYGVGPKLTYDLYDGGLQSKKTESVEYFVKAKIHEKNASLLKAVLETRQAYARIQGGFEELRLVDESLRLLQARAQNIANRWGAGGASRLELLSVKREEDLLKFHYIQTQESLAEAIVKLTTLTELGNLPQPLVPGPQASGKTAAGIPQPNLILNLDPMETTLKHLRPQIGMKPNLSHPNLASLSAVVEATNLASEAKSKEALPNVQLFAKSSYEYPNGPIDERVWQNSVGLSVVLTLFDGGLRKDLSASKLAEARAFEVQRAKVERDFVEMWQRTETSLKSIQGQKELVNSATLTAEQEARLTMTNYKAGSATYLDVQRANAQVLEVKTTLLRLKSQEIALLATLAYLSAGVEAPQQVGLRR